MKMANGVVADAILTFKVSISKVSEMIRLDTGDRRLEIKDFSRSFEMTGRRLETGGVCNFPYELPH